MKKKTLDSNVLARVRYELEGIEMEPHVKKLFDEKIAVLRQIAALNRRAGAIDTALEILGIRVDTKEAMMRGYVRVTRLDNRYASELPFKDKTIAEACLSIINDHEGLALDKKQVEYSLALGGYQFETKDPINSVEIALRKLASDGKCDPIKGSGTQMSRYRSLAGVPSDSAFDYEASKKGNADDIDDSDSGATT